MIGLAYYFRDPLSHAWSQFMMRSFPCSQPIAYSIGDFDTRFGISKETFLKDIQRAESIWETPVKKELFVYKPDSALKINLIYDDRQTATQKLQKLGIIIHDDQSTYNTLKAKYDVQTKQIQNLKASYAVASVSYQSRQTAYNNEVESLNKRGRVTQDIYDRLAQEKKDLDQLSVKLSEQEGVINAHVDVLNALVEVINRLARSLNLKAVQYNETGAIRGGEFEEGEYVTDVSGNRINIYQFDDQTKLIRVLTHELGHALGLDHIDNPKAIMYRLNNGVNEALTDGDLAELKRQCQMK